MRVRTVYLKVTDMMAETAFWRSFLESAPTKQSSGWTEFLVDEVRVALLLQEEGDTVVGSGCVPVFEVQPDALPGFIDRVQELGGSIVFDGLENPDIQSIVLADPEGREFELTVFHD
jgi:predicted enzyme related to lactoylglutathione lyase